MGGPPSHIVEYKFIDNNEYYLISIKLLLKKFRCSMKGLVKKISRYINKHPEIVKSELIGRYTVLKTIKTDNNKRYIPITNIDTIINILLKTYNGLYVPNKELNIVKERFEQSYLIKKEDLEYGK